jgi:hypothetical protein
MIRCLLPSANNERGQAVNHPISRPAFPIITSLSLLACGAGCREVWDARMYNNSGQVRDVRVGGKESSWPAGTVWKGPYLGREGILIRGGDQDWRYEQQLPPASYVQTRGLGKTNNTVSLQLEPDGSLFALKPDQQPPAPQPIDQPPGWPMRPRVRSESGSTTAQSEARGVEVGDAIRLRVLRLLPNLSEIRRIIILSRNPTLTGHYTTAGDYGQYFLRWDFGDGTWLDVGYTGTLNDPNPSDGSVQPTLHEAKGGS